jgi:hypothetical protein
MNLLQDSAYADGRIALFNWDDGSPKRFQNLQRIEQARSVVWKAELPDASEALPDFYVSFEIRGERLFANSWSCYRVEIDTANGALISQVFTK